MNSIGQRIKHFREQKGWSQARLAKESGVSQSAIAAAELDPTRKPREIIEIAHALGVAPTELAGRKALNFPATTPAPNSGNISSSPRPISAWDDGDPVEEDEVEVPRLTLKVSAGSGRLQWEIDESGLKNRFRRSWCQRKGFKPEGLLTILVDGDSMSPTIPDRASLTINTFNTSLRSGKVHAIDFHGEFYVKRLFRRADGGVLIRSDNQDKTRHPDWEVGPEHGDALRILGAVVSMSTDID